MVNIYNMAESAVFCPGAWELLLSDAELQFDLNIVGAHLLPADFNLRTTTLHYACHIEGSSLFSLTETVICHPSINNRRGLQHPDNLTQKSRKCVGCNELERCSWPVSNVL